MTATYICEECGWRYASALLGKHFAAHHAAGARIGIRRWMSEVELTSWQPGQDPAPTIMDNDHEYFTWGTTEGPPTFRSDPIDHRPFVVQGSRW